MSSEITLIQWPSGLVVKYPTGELEMRVRYFDESRLSSFPYLFLFRFFLYLQVKLVATWVCFLAAVF